MLRQMNKMMNAGGHHRALCDAMQIVSLRPAAAVTTSKPIQCLPMAITRLRPVQAACTTCRSMSTDSTKDVNTPARNNFWDRFPMFRTDLGTPSTTAISNSSFSTQARNVAMNPFGIVTTPASPAFSTARPRISRNNGPRVRRQRSPLRHQPESVAGRLYPVSAIHIAQTIDLFPLVSTVFTHQLIRKQLFGKSSIVVQLPPVTEHDPPRYVAVFRFGSVVFLNVSPPEIAQLVRDIKKYSKEPVPTGFERKESFGILVKPDMYEETTEEESSGPATPTVTGDYCIVPELDMNGVAVISNIMGQTVALDTYNDTVDDLLANFASINSTVAKTGKFTATDKDSLFKTVAQNNSIFIDMISKIRIKDRSETAWSITKYETIHYGLKSEFELDERFDQIEYKLSLIQDNAKFFLDVLQSQKSNSLEWIIVILISVECVIMCTDMSGYGEVVFATMCSLIPPYG
jgi:uncharacterized Rmd1/YagE family protein